MLPEKTLLRLQLVAAAIVYFSPLESVAEERAGRDWWSLQPLARVEPPDIGQEHVIDAFVFAKLQEHGLGPSGMASPRVQMRRLHFDLVGMPSLVEKSLEKSGLAIGWTWPALGRAMDLSETIRATTCGPTVTG